MEFLGFYISFWFFLTTGIYNLILGIYNRNKTDLIPDVITSIQILLVKFSLGNDEADDLKKKNNLNKQKFQNLYLFLGVFCLVLALYIGTYS